VTEPRLALRPALRAAAAIPITEDMIATCLDPDSETDKLFDRAAATI
jgi:hypothetical protein